MNHRRIHRLLACVSAACLAAPLVAHAQTFTDSGTGNVIAGFRKTGAHQGNYELVVNLGNVANFLSVPMGSQISVPIPSPSQLSDAFADGYQDLQWSVFAAFTGVNPLTNSLGVFPGGTIWYSLGRTNAGIQTAAQSRFVSSFQYNVHSYMLAVGQNANSISTALGATNSDNNSVLVREPVTGNAALDLTASIGDPNNTAIGDFNGEFNFSVENTTPDSFTSVSRTDFYQSVPASVLGGRGAVTNIDPVTGQTNGFAYFVGYFDLNTNGTLTFTRATTNAPPPPAPTLSITRSGTTRTISFTATNTATYTLIFTNLSGLTSPRSNWITLGSPITGVSGSTNFTDTSTDPGRVYSVTAQ